MTARSRRPAISENNLNLPVVCPAIKETTALGAAYAADLAVGYYGNADDLRENWAVDRTWTPNMGKDTRESFYRTWKKAETRSFDWIE